MSLFWELGPTQPPRGQMGPRPGHSLDPRPWLWCPLLWTVGLGLGTQDKREPCASSSLWGHPLEGEGGAL